MQSFVICFGRVIAFTLAAQVGGHIQFCKSMFVFVFVPDRSFGGAKCKNITCIRYLY